MTDRDEHDLQDLADVIRLACGPETFPDGAVLTGFVLVIEWVDTDGERWLQREHPPESTVWQRLGLLEAAAAAERHSMGNWPTSGDDE